MRINAKKYGSSISIKDARSGFVDSALAKGEGLFWVAPVQKAAEQIFEAIKQKKKVVYITKRWRLIAPLLRIIPFSILKGFKLKRNINIQSITLLLLYLLPFSTKNAAIMQWSEYVTTNKLKV